VGSIVRARKN